ncbi:hypothetical protein QJS04_geneDACA012128 [Acorus gramineus]|uniref:Uncharacterized protein n=1 Tax=Acorus gramineus TaxID=55184 RepID=A0AAV9BCD0_ACOGR|nr:hypothetical protein QJS04_geneDACA012128 [Acorus gramineus]
MQSGPSQQTSGESGDDPGSFVNKSGRVDNSDTQYTQSMPGNTSLGLESTPSQQTLSASGNDAGSASSPSRWTSSEPGKDHDIAVD